MKENKDSQDIGTRTASAPVSGHGAASSGRLAAAQISPHNNFDLVRLVAATQVAIYHTTLLLGLHLWTPLQYVVVAIPGVPIFFVTSGFLLAGSLERDPDLRRYARNRVLRIYPALWLCFATTLIVLAATNVLTRTLLLSLRGVAWIVAQLTVASTTPAQIHKFGAGGAPNGSLWTIAVELGFYVVLALVWILWVKRVPRALADGGLVGIVFASFALAALTGTVNSTETSTFEKLFSISPVPYLWVFFIGVLLRRRWGTFRPLLEGRAYLWIPLAVFGYHVLPGLSGTPHGSAWLGLAVDRLLLGLAGVSAAFSVPRLADRTLRGIDLSYGLYLYHFVWINTAIELHHRRSWPAGAVVLLTSVASAACSWFLVEHPCLNRKSRTKNQPAAAVVRPERAKPAADHLAD